MAKAVAGKTDVSVVEGHPFNELVADEAQAGRIRQRVAELVNQDAALKKVRVAAGIAQKDLAAKLAVSPAAVAQLESRDLDVVQLGTIRRYFEALGYDIELHVRAIEKKRPRRRAG